MGKSDGGKAGEDEEEGGGYGVTSSAPNEPEPSPSAEPGEPGDTGAGVKGAGSMHQFSYSEDDIARERDLVARKAEERRREAGVGGGGRDKERRGMSLKEYLAKRNQ